MTDNELIGKMVYSKSGRDEGRYFLIVGIINEDYVYISDGDLRPVERPKKKKVKHLNISNKKDDNIAELIRIGENVSNRMVRQYILSMNSNEEV